MTIRLGYHGSAAMAADLVRTAGRTPAEVTLHEYDVADPFRLLRAGGLDVMIAKFLVREPDLDRSTTLFTDARALVVGETHPLAARDALVLEDLADADGFACPGTMPGYVWDEVVPPTTPSGRPIHRRHALATTAGMMAVVRSGAGVHLSLASLAEVAPPGVRIVPVLDMAPAPVFLTWVRGRLPDPVRDFVRAAEEAAEEAAETAAAEVAS